jgi:hypothetical protein
VAGGIGAVIVRDAGRPRAGDRSATRAVRVCFGGQLGAVVAQLVGQLRAGRELIGDGDAGGVEFCPQPGLSGLLAEQFGFVLESPVERGAGEPGDGGLVGVEFGQDGQLVQGQVTAGGGRLGAGGRRHGPGGDRVGDVLAGQAGCFAHAGLRGAGLAGGGQRCGLSGGFELDALLAGGHHTQVLPGQVSGTAGDQVAGDCGEPGHDRGRVPPGAVDDPVPVTVVAGRDPQRHQQSRHRVFRALTSVLGRPAPPNGLPRIPPHGTARSQPG